MSMPTFNYSGRTVFIAGGTSGINLGIAGAFANAGARLAVLGRSPERLDQAQTRLHKFGGEVRGYSADVRDAPAVAVALKAAYDALGAIDVLVSGAAGNFPAPALGMSPNGFKAVIDIDLLGTFNVLRLGHEFLRKPGAATINISAPQGTIAMPLQAHVCAAKAGVDMLTQALALEWGADGIRVNAIVPGPIAGTEGMARLAPTPEAMANVARGVPLGRLGTTQDVADLALFLTSPRAAFITGAIIPVDGGWTANSTGGLRTAMRPQQAT